MKQLNNLKIKNFIILFFAGIINAVGVTMFLQPVKLYDSGISGTSMLLDMVTPDFLSLSVFLVVLNIPIFYLVSESRDLNLRFTLFILSQFTQ